MTAGETPSVDIAVLTYRRPEDLGAALDALVVQAESIRPTARVLVIDNDEEASGETVVRALGSDLVRYVHEPTPGIAAARNRAMAESDADLIVFIDDDERPTPGWLTHLVAQYLRDRPAGVVGPVVSECAGQPDPWIVAGGFFVRPRLRTGTPVAAAATNNLLLDLAQVKALGVGFDNRLGLSGGSDNLFTRDLVRKGGRLVWCDEALVVDVVPPARLTRSWVLRRAFRGGNTRARVSVDLADRRTERLVARITETTQGLARITGGGARWALGVMTGSLSHRARGRRTIYRGAGRIAGANGWIYSEYARGPRRGALARDSR